MGGTQIVGQEMTCRGGGSLAFSLEIMNFTETAVSARTVIFTQTATLVISMETIETCCFRGEPHHAGAGNVE